ncbi:histidine kinase [Pseudoflavitalea sp. G-6-1-2]|uniref:sensor histidine kinase n=1 Tax=Pseudoflavitalea sp. G-6-1-2 TaxID=2728841 RepID=UPI00146C4686|nr:histidine kinase [Pseudoflavitalea sp. G-6-1-2]NML22321.1 histidine kinase [Pseudoflavitalea sp. G-6-1-2]
MKPPPFKISHTIIWGSSLLLAIIIALPQLVSRHFNLYEMLANSAITFIFSIFVWYYSVYMLPAYSSKDLAKGFSVTRLMKTLGIGILLMFMLAYLQQLILSHLDFGATMLMIEVRGILISLTFYMFIHLLYQNYHNQQVSIALERSKMDNLAAQYELLRQQVNPHFLFNSLNTLKYMVESNDKHSVEFILKLSDFYRFTLESRKSDLIPLSEELKILNAFIFLLKARFEEGLEIAIQLQPQLDNCRIPPFTLQLLVENAVKHNIVSTDRPLQIRIFAEGNNLVVENTLQLKRNPEAGTGIGLDNINQRYQHLAGKEIQITPTEKYFTVKLPLLYEDRDR